MTCREAARHAAPCRRPRAVAFAVGLVSTTLVVGCARDRQVQLDAAAERGRVVAQRAGCTGCHTGLDSDASIGPTWKGKWGTEVPLDDGTQVPFDETFVRNAVRDPDLQRRKGNWLHMPAYGTTQVSDADLADLVAYLRALGGA